MNDGLVTFIILPSDVESVVAARAAEHAAFDPSHRRAVYMPGTRGDAVALTVRADGTICDVVCRTQALSEAWIEELFVRAAR